MPTRMLVVCALSLAAMSLAACQAAPPAGLSDADKAALRQNDKAITDAANGGNFAAAISFYQEDAGLLPPNSAVAQGREQIQKWMAGNPPISGFTIDSVDVDGRGDLAYVRGNYALTLTPPGAAAIHDRGKFVEIWRRQADGAWKIKWDIFNSDLPPPQ
jgi:ketosteroid isomerase-like protein